MSKEKISVFDNGGRTWDRYTVIIGSSVYTMSENPTSPQGFNQYCCEVLQLNLEAFRGDKYVEVSKLPDEVKKAIRERL